MVTDSMLELTSGTTVVSIAANQGGRIAKWSVDGLDLLGEMDHSDVGWGSYPLVPWQGRLSGNVVAWRGTSHPMPTTFAQWALHGRTYFRPWDVVELSDTHAVLQTSIGRDDGDPWPWPTVITAEYRLHDGALHTRLEAAPAASPMEVPLKSTLDRVACFSAETATS
jgi:aldose 1-epimerase